jgi:hypothetical protein
MQLLWRGFASHCRLETWILMSVLTISVLLFAFGLIAQEVSEGELLTFDKSVMRALRNPANPSIPIGPPWLQEAARNITSLGSTIVLGIISLAVVGYLFFGSQTRRGLADPGCCSGRDRAEQSPQICVRSRSPRFCKSCGAGLYHKLPKWPCHIICHHLPDDRSTSRANPPFIHNTPIRHVARGISNRAHRSESNLPRCPFSDRCSRGLVHWCGLGHGLLGAGGVAPK